MSMRVYIKGMEMPERCGECKLKAVYDDETFCPFFTDNVECWIAAGRRHEDCPLGSLLPHGRLIDVEVLCERLMTAWHTADSEGRRIIGEVIADVVVPIVVSMPTIIPAEEGEA